MTKPNYSGVKFVFEDSARDFILEAFNKTVDTDGYVVEMTDQKKRVLTIDGQEIRKEQFAGVRKGSEIFVRSDITSLIEMGEDIRSKTKSRWNGSLTSDN